MPAFADPTMRILLITPNAPSRSHVNGGATRMHRLYSRLIRLGNAVTIVGVFTHDQRATIECLRDEGFEVFPHVRSQRRLGELANAIRRRPALLRGASSLSSKELISSVFWVDLAAQVEKAFDAGGFDAIVIESSFAAFWLDQLNTDIPVVLATHEVESTQLLAKAARIGGLAGLARYADGRRVRRSEQHWTPKFDGLIVVSADEARSIAAIVGENEVPRTYVIGNGADIKPIESIAADPGEQRVLFTGTLDYSPNAVGAQWLAKEVWPHVLRASPRARLQIVGARPSAATRELGQLPAVSVEGDVADIGSWLAAASVCTLPMLEGGGTRLKLLDAFAAQRAVVSTTNGATGIDCRSGRDILVGDTPEEFARAITRLLNDRVLRDHIARRGREIAERSYDWDALGDDFHSALADVVSRRRATPIALAASSTRG